MKSGDATPLLHSYAGYIWHIFEHAGKEIKLNYTNKIIPFMLLFCALQLILCGCVPAFYTYWAPHAEGGKLSSHGQLAHSNSVEFIFDGVKVSFTGQGTLVGMSLDIPKEKSVAFTFDKVWIAPSLWTHSTSHSDVILKPPKKSQISDIIYCHMPYC